MSSVTPLWRITEPTQSSDYPACSGVGLCAKEEAGAHGLTAGIDAEFQAYGYVLPLLAPLVVGSWVEHVRIGRVVQRRQYCSGHSRNAGQGVADEVHLTRQSAVDGLWRRGSRVLALVMTLMMAPGHLLLQILQCLVHCPVHFAGLRAGLSLPPR